MPLGDTIIAPASAPGRSPSPRAVIRLSGPATRDALAALSADPPRPFERACYRARLRLPPAPHLITPSPHHLITLPILLATYRAPASYTGEDSAEILLPGNPHLVERVLAAFTALPGLRPAAPGEFTARAFLNDKLSLSEAEGVAAAIAAQTDEQLAAARDLLRGRTGDTYSRWANDLAALLALVEAGIDFTDQEDVVPIAPADLKRRLAALADDLSARLGSRAGHAPAPALPRVVLAGEPSAGKSTLFNALLGRRRAAVSPHPGTTRDILEEELDLSRDLPGAGPVLLCDAAGLDDRPGSRPDPSAAAAAQRAARDAIAGADLILYCDPTGRFALRFDTPTLHLRTKADLPSSSTAPAGAHDGTPLALCALDGFNLPTLRRAIADAATAARAGPRADLLPRHRLALAAAQGHLLQAAATIDPAARALPDPAITANALRAALDHLGELTGRLSPDDIIGRIFATFCVGK